MNYKKIYFRHFDIGEQDFIFDEYEFIVNKRNVKAHNIHHVLFGANKVDKIENLMALSFENHSKAHQEKLKRNYLMEVHLQFLENNPY